MRILPGMISGAGWTGPRCEICARPIGGDGSDPGMTVCGDSGYPNHLTFADVSPEKLRRFVESNAVANASQAHASVLDAIEWMATPRQWGAHTALLSAVQMIRDGRGLEVLEAQFAAFPHLARVAEAAERATAALRAAAA